MPNTNFDLRVAAIEKSLTRLTVIQEHQSKQTDHIIANLEKQSKLAESLANHAKDLSYQHEAITVMHKETKANSETISKVRDEMTKLSFTRLKLSIGVTVSIVTAVFGYMYKDLHYNSTQCRALEKQVYHLEMRVKEIPFEKIKR